MGKKSTWTKHWQNLTQIGARFNLSAVSVGKILKEQGWKDEDNKPTEESLARNRAVSCPLRSGIENYRWSKPAVYKLLLSLGHEQVSPQAAKMKLTIKDLASMYRALERDEMHGHKFYCVFEDECKQKTARFNRDEFLTILQSTTLKKEIKDAIEESSAP